MRRAEMVGAWAVLALGLFISAYSLHYEFYTELGPGPGFLPLMLGIGILIGGVIEVAKTSLAGKKGEGPFLSPKSKSGFQMLALIVVGFLLIPLLGISISLSVATGAAMKVIGRHRTLTCVLTAAGSTIFIYFVFGQWLDIPLPKGLVGI